MNSKTPGLYIHIPFCISKCHYCDFYSLASISAIPDFLDALFKEMKMYGDRFNSFDTVYIGGGTPSLLTPQQLEDILINVKESFHLVSDPEITIEANPADLNRSFLESIRGSGINRINVGVQSFDEPVLGFLGRRHSAKQVFSAVEASRKARFDNIGLDLIYGVPGQDIESWLNTLRQALVFSPEHISCYQLTLEPETPLGKRCRTGELALPGEELQYQFFMKTSEFLEDAGYIHYEVSNFAKKEKYVSRHNQKYWDHSPFLGLGPSAHSFQCNHRWWNHRSLDRYFALVHAENLPIEETETLTIEQLRLEAFYLGLRTKRGVSLQDLKNLYDYNPLKEKTRTVARLEEEGFISIQEGYLRPTRTGLAVADSLSLI
jgi:oxygen-independent coproporphyrinogen-3 oxidase